MCEGVLVDCGDLLICFDFDLLVCEVCVVMILVIVINFDFFMI